MRIDGPCDMIVSFGDKATEDVYHGRGTSRARRFPAAILDVSLVKLDLLNGAATLQDLKAPPGNRLEPLRGDLEGFHSIRVNEQWRLVFKWTDGNAHSVRLIDYHK